MEKTEELVSRLKLLNLVKTGIVYCPECRKQIRDGDDKTIGGVFLRHTSPCNAQWRERAKKRPNWIN